MVEVRSLIRALARRRFAFLVLTWCAATASIGNAGRIDKVWRWQPDPQWNQQGYGARGFWRGELWGLDYLGGKIWSFDGQTYHDGGRMPGKRMPLTSLFTDHGLFALGPNREGAPQVLSPADISYSPDGYQDFWDVYPSAEEDSSGNGLVLSQSMVDLGEGRLLYFQYSRDSRVMYSADSGQSWQRLFQPEPNSIGHFHGSYYDRDYGKLYVMSGDGDSHSSIVVTDDLFGEDGLINNPALWRTRWGMDDVGRSTRDERYFLKPDGVALSQRTRSTAMEVDGDYIYWGEDRAINGISLYRANRQTLEVNEVGQGDLIGAPWMFLKTSDDRFLFLTNSIHYQGKLVAGSDDFVHLYEMNGDRSDYEELARFPAKKNAYSGADPFGFVEAFGRLWISGYNITDVSKDLVGQLVLVTLGDFDDDGQLSVADLDVLSAAVRSQNTLPIYDLDLSGSVDQIDRRVWIEDLKQTYFGDANLDGQFSTEDFVYVLIAGEYEDQLAGNSTWSSGDWNGDGEFGSEDLVAAFQSGGYEQGFRLATPSFVVPEPNGLVIGAIAVARAARRNRTR